ncbi:MAG: ABC transporter permease [Proteobacteria bacterium]|nr:ABC transporter permease [Pseudomonadota bacterium]MBS0573749.1 ABC transporter permease [Pseudomonadota bacterium]
MTGRIRASWRSVALMGPAAAVLGFLFLLPLVWFLVVSFYRVQLFQMIPDASLANYTKVLADYAGPIAFTAAIAAAIAAITTVLAFVVAHMIWARGGAFGAFLLGATLLTLFGGYLVKIYAWRTILGREGVINSTLVGLGLVKQPIDALLYSPTAVVLVLVSYLLPFAILPLYGALRAVDPVSIEAARDLGATPAGVLRDAVLPLCVPALATSFALCFLLTAGDFVTPRLVGGTQTFMMGNFIESQFGLRMNVPLGAAMTFTTLVTSVCVIGAAWAGLRHFLRAK